MRLLFLLCLVIYMIYVEILSVRSLHMLQQNRYNRGLRYTKWIFRNFKENFCSINLILILFAVPLFLENLNDLCIFCLLIVLYFLIHISYEENKHKEYKLPLKYTARIKRLLISETFIYGLTCLLMFVFYEESLARTYCFVLAMMAYLNLFVILLCNFINRPVEKMVNCHFKSKAIKKLKEMSNMEVVGITGSYGKTSTKNVVYEILDSNFNVFKTPENFNTPYGLMISINEKMDRYNDYFIAEMGACKKGDIKELCDFVKPKYGIVTSIGLAHLETFGSEENILRTKFELIESLPSDGIGVLNIDDHKQCSYRIKNNCKVVWIGIDNKDADYLATDIKMDYQGMSFKLKMKDKKEKYSFKTKLLGRNNIYNILDGLALGIELGMNIDVLQHAVENLEAVEHRLSMKNYYNVTLIDDAYNSNPSGAKMALEVLSMMPGKHIVVTPGMIEIGKKEDACNREFGQEIAQVCDEVILIGKEKTKAIYEGILEKGFDSSNIRVYNDVMDAFAYLKEINGEETYVLLENDLPDVFMEKK